MLTQITTQPMDPRDPPVQVRDYPDPPLHLVVSHTPRIPEAIDAGSAPAAALRERDRQRREVLEADLPAAAEDLMASQITDSIFRQRVATVLPADIPEAQRLDAGAVAVRLHDPLWQAVGRYRAAEAALLILRNLLSERGLAAVVPDAVLRQTADRLAGVLHQEQVRAWTGQAPVSDTTWAMARAGLLSITEEGL